jgi:uncharacterized damage-inducible protein DinB
MSPDQDEKAQLRSYLKGGFDALLWKLEGLSEYDVRRPMTRTGTNLLGIVKHVASVQLGYLGEVFARPSGVPLPWLAEDAAPNADMWASAQESRAQVLELARLSWAHAEETIAALPLDAPGTVPWWSPEARSVTLRRVLLHLVAEVQRHAGHADVVRELLDGAAGLLDGNDNLPALHDWAQYRERLEQAAREASSG